MIATDFTAVVMAGGQGQRFWPLSTADRPKQFLDLERNGRTLLQSTVDRLLPLTGGFEHLYVATVARYVPLVHEQLPDLPRCNVIVEPTPRDSAPAVALASLVIHERTGGTNLGFFSSDHRIGNVPAFQEAVRQAVALADAERGLVALGIAPTHAATGYGYIQRGAVVGTGHRVERFVEKPSAHTAQHYLDTGDYLWNAGIFIWRSDVVLTELDRHAPEIMRPLRGAVAAGTVADVFAHLPKVSIDYALMEPTDRAYVVPLACAWDDIGDWVALERLFDQDADTNTIVGTHVGHEASGNIIYTDGPDDVIVMVGVHDLVVVKRGDTVLLLAKNGVADLKTLLADERLTDRGTTGTNRS